MLCVLVPALVDRGEEMSFAKVAQWTRGQERGGGGLSHLFTPPFETLTPRG